MLAPWGGGLLSIASNTMAVDDGALGREIAVNSQRLREGDCHQCWHHNRGITINAGALGRGIAINSWCLGEGHRHQSWRLDGGIAINAGTTMSAITINVRAMRSTLAAVK